MGNSEQVIRKKLGLVYFNDEQWIGGTYYTINLVHALNYLPTNEKPEIIAFSNPLDFQHLQAETNYPYLTFEDFSKSEYSKYESLINKFSVKFFKRKAFSKKYYKDIDAFFIMQRSEYIESIPAEKRIYWIPDFQDKYFPHYFTKEGFAKKHKRSLWIHQNAKKLILSSESVKRDWDEFYPNFKGKTSVIHFAVTHPEFESLSISELSKKFNLPKIYFFSPNQFWAHKNHMVVIKAAEILKNQGAPIVLVFSGKENDNRNPRYTESLKDYVKNKNLEDVVKFLGFLDRREQLKIMKYAKAIIQPSLFEGWSTVIEDAMAMNQVVIASDLDVNSEQLGEKAIYFKRNCAVDLANCIKKIGQSSCIRINYDYSQKISDFAEGIQALID